MLIGEKMVKDCQEMKEVGQDVKRKFNKMMLAKMVILFNYIE